MSNTEHAGVSHQDIFTAIARVRGAVPASTGSVFLDNGFRTHYFLHSLLKSYVLHTVSPIWFCKPKRKVRGIQRERDLTGMPTELLELPDNQYLVTYCQSWLERCLTGLFWREMQYVWWQICGVDMHWMGFSVWVELCAHCVMLLRGSELLRGLRLH